MLCLENANVDIQKDNCALGSFMKYDRCVFLFLLMKYMNGMLIMDDDFQIFF